MPEDKKIRVFDAEKNIELEVRSLGFMLPGGASFVMDTEPGRDGSAVFLIPGEEMTEDRVEAFSLEPGAINVFAVNVRRVGRA